jgi:hypothetical protein
MTSVGSGAKAARLKDEGNALFKAGNFKDAVLKYSQGTVIHATLS